MDLSNKHQKTTVFRPWSDEKPGPSKDYVLASPASSPTSTLASTPSTSRSSSSSSSSSPNPGETNCFPMESFAQSEPPVSNFSLSNLGFAVQPHFLQYCMPVNSYTPYFPWSSAPTIFPTAYDPIPKVLPIKPVALCPGEQVQQTVQCLGEQEAKVKKVSRSRSKSIACPHPGCVSTFSKKGQLTAHCRIHTGERPFECEVCSKKFTRKEELTRHKRIHTGVKPFGCDQCGKRFGRSDHLKTHEKIHKRDHARMAEAARNYASVYNMSVTGFGYPQYHPLASYATPFYHPH